MFAEDASSGAAAEELSSALAWVEGELAKGSGPLFMGADFTLVRGRGSASAWCVVHSVSLRVAVCTQQEE